MLQARPKNELDGMNSLLEELSGSSGEAVCILPEVGMLIKKRFLGIGLLARESWAGAAFTLTNDLCLSRYYSYHFMVIASCSDLLRNLMDAQSDRMGCPQRNELFRIFEEELCRLADHLCFFFRKHIEPNQKAPVCWQEHVILKMAAENFRIAGLIAARLPSAGLADILCTYLGRFATGARTFSVGELLYYVDFIMALSGIVSNDGIDELELAEKLIGINFNQLAFFVYEKDKLSLSVRHLSSAGKIAVLKERAGLPLAISSAADLAYDRRLPSLEQMLRYWITEELVLLEAEITRSLPMNLVPKIKLNIPVAQLALIIRLFYQLRFFAEDNLSVIFQFFSANFESKRQQAISPKSLSNEYYDASQITAARVLELLENMIRQLRTTYFPVVAAIGITFLFR
ncbi:hypothetical protein ACFFGT_10550 [Mucilaginibacter angelicae]|uniref:Uncharacterized protein n=1 Tax=Mucilaginibacter angelicae TaxID=869718 RepID=A0ABV6L581_9SPHI